MMFMHMYLRAENCVVASHGRPHSLTAHWPTHSESSHMTSYQCWLYIPILTVQSNDNRQQANNMQTIKQAMFFCYCWWSNVQYITEKCAISGVHVSPGRAETLLKCGGQTNHHMIADSVNQCLYQKLLQPGDICQSYSVPSRCRS